MRSIPLEASSPASPSAALTLIIHTGSWLPLTVRLAV